MPTYEYRCTTCGHTFETFQRFDDAPVTICPECGSPVQKVFSSVGVVFKGSGFYSTDNKKSRKAATPAKDTTADSKSGDTKKDTAPAKEPSPAKDSKPKPTKTGD